MAKKRVTIGFRNFYLSLFNSVMPLWHSKLIKSKSFSDLDSFSSFLGIFAAIFLFEAFDLIFYNFET